MAENEKSGAVSTVDLRDFIAAHALAGLLAKGAPGTYPLAMPKLAYEVADEMLAERASNNSR